MPPSAKYCPGCGQKKYAGPPTLWTLFSGFFETVFNLDNRLFRTLRDLVIPGQLTIKFLAGRQRPYFQPLRLFFASTVLMLSAYAIFTADRVGKKFDASIENARSNAYHKVFEHDMLQQLDSLEEEFPTTDAQALLDTIRARHLTMEQDSMHLGIIDIKADNSLDGKELVIPAVDFHTLPIDTLIQKYNIENWIAQYQVKQIVSVSRSGSRAIAGIMGQLIWGVVFLIPLSALMLKLIYIRRKRTYVEHLVFSLHVHAFLFLLQALAAIVFYWFNSNILLWATIPLTILYFIAAQKHVYNQGWIKTLIKAWLLFFGYTMILSMAFGFGMLGALLLY